MVFEVFTLGEFKIKYNDIELTETDIHSDMISKLLIYMIGHREKPVESEKIISELWTKGDVDNPAGTLKNLMYRLRNILKKNLGDDDFIISTRGFYSWNNDIEVILDCELFEKFVSNGKFTANKLTKLLNYQKACEIYKGDFLPKHTSTGWVNINNTYYHGLFLQCSKELLSLYMEEERYNEIAQLVNKCLEIDKVVEEYYYYSMLICVNENAIQMGLDIYKNSVKLLQKELGVNEFSLLTSAYHKLLALDHGNLISSLEKVKSELDESQEKGPFICGYEIFKQIFLLETKKYKRTKTNSGSILFMTLEFPYDINSSKIEKFRASRTTRAYLETLAEVLRTGDVISKYSDSQFIAMLPDCLVENIGVLIGRINSNFYEKYPQYVNINIKYEYEDVSLMTDENKKK